MAYKAQTATKLYTSHISAIIVLVELSELNRSRDHQGSAYGWRQYRTGKGSNKALFDRCRHSTEFHFPDIESQLTVIESDFASRPDGLQEGNFFVTRHSNLPLTQVVFHLIIDSDGKHPSLCRRSSPANTVQRHYYHRTIQPPFFGERSSEHSATRHPIRYLFVIDTSLAFAWPIPWTTRTSFLCSLLGSTSATLRLAPKTRRSGHEMCQRIPYWKLT